MAVTKEQIEIGALYEMDHYFIRYWGDCWNYMRRARIVNYDPDNDYYYLINTDGCRFCDYDGSLHLPGHAVSAGHLHEAITRKIEE